MIRKHKQLIWSAQAAKVLIIFASLGLMAASCIKQAPKMPVSITSTETAPAVATRVSDKEFKAFSHKIEEHQQFECASCHQREGRSLDMAFAGHESCVGCHLNQFTDRQQTMCAICHDDLKDTPPTMNKFPVQFQEGFNMKFDHSAHDSGKGRPPQGCASCHLPAGAGKSIPAGFQAHNTCYTCHTPDSQIGQCNVCHELKPYSRTPQSRYVFRAVFRHDDHSPRQGVSCNECHGVRPGAPQGRQVTNISASEHSGAGNNCATCHNGSRAFGGNGANDFANCARCHKGSGFNMLP